MDICLIFHDGRIDDNTANSIAAAILIVERLHENGDITKPSLKELKDEQSN